MAENITYNTPMGPVESLPHQTARVLALSDAAICREGNQRPCDPVAFEDLQRRIREGHVAYEEGRRGFYVVGDSTDVFLGMLEQAGCTAQWLSKWEDLARFLGPQSAYGCRITSEIDQLRARGFDRHDILVERLGKLAPLCDPAVVYATFGPMLDREE